eukprot:3305701-Rhodomonas_salina.1
MVWVLVGWTGVRCSAAGCARKRGAADISAGGAVRRRRSDADEAPCLRSARGLIARQGDGRGNS